MPPLKPLLIERDDDPLAEPPATVAPGAGPADRAGAGRRPRLTRRRAARPLSRFALWVFGALFTFVLSVAAWDFVTGLLARDSRAGLGRLRAGRRWRCWSALVLALREWAAFARLARLDTLRTRAAEARMPTADMPRGARVVAGAGHGFTPRRPDTGLGPGAAGRARGPRCSTPMACWHWPRRELLAPLDAGGAARDRGGGAAGGHGHGAGAAGAGRCGDGAVLPTCG